MLTFYCLYFFSQLQLSLLDRWVVDMLGNENTGILNEGVQLPGLGGFTAVEVGDCWQDWFKARTDGKSAEYQELLQEKKKSAHSYGCWVVRKLKAIFTPRIFAVVFHKKVSAVDETHIKQKLTHFSPSRRERRRASRRRTR